MAQAFNCKKASTVVEKEICANVHLGVLDSDLAKAYKEATNTPGLDKDYLLKTQREFIKSREGCARRADLYNCVEAETRGRTGELAAMMAPFMPTAQGQGNVRALTGQYVFSSDATEGVITVSELPGGVLSLEYESYHEGFSCLVENLTISRREAEQYVANNRPVPFYLPDEDFEIKITYADNGVQLDQYLRRNDPQDSSVVPFCGANGFIFDNTFYAKTK